MGTWRGPGSKPTRYPFMHKSIKTTERHYAKWVKGRQDRLDALVTASWNVTKDVE